MKKYDNFELLLHAAAEEYMEKKAEEFSAIDTTEIADQIRMRNRAKKLIERSRKNYRTRILKIVAVACLAALLLATTACLSISEIREKFYEVFVQLFDGYLAVDFEEGNPNARPPQETETESETETETESLPLTPPTKIEHKAYASYLPEAYTCVVEVETKMYYHLSFYDLNNNWKFTLSQEVIYEAPYLQDSDNKQTEIVYIHGNQAYLLKDSSQPNVYSLVWRDAYYQYSLHGIFSSKETLMQIAKGIELN